MLILGCRTGPAAVWKVAAFLLLYHLAAAAWACAGVDTALTDARKQEYAKLVSAATDGKAAPATVSISAFMKSGDWSAVYAATQIADDGVFFFHNGNFEDVWGGMAEESERGEVVAWAEKLGAPSDLAQCFADTVID